MGNKESKSKKNKPHEKPTTTDHLPTSQPPVPTKTLPPGPLKNDGDWLPKITDEAAWNSMKHAPTDRSFSNISVVKVIVPNNPRVATESEIFFIQSDKWVFHWHFTRDILLDPGSQDLGEFNALNYQAEDRDFICLTVTKYHDFDEEGGLYSFELAARDPLSLEKLVSTFELIKKNVYFGEQLAYRPLSKLQEGIVANVDSNLLKLVSADKIYGGVKYQPLTIGTTYGYLRLVHEATEDEDVDKAKWNDILLCESIPNDLPVISGLITAVLQTPLCHVALLCGNRGTPNMASVGIFEDQKILSLVGKPVKLVVSKATFTIEESAPEVVDKWQARVFQKLRKGTNITLQSDVGQDQVVYFRDVIGLRQMEYAVITNSVGAKSLNCLEMARKNESMKAQGMEISNILSLNSFVVPYFYYQALMNDIFVDETSTHMIEGKAVPAKEKLGTSPKSFYDDLVLDAKTNETPDSKDYSTKCAQIKELILSIEWKDPSDESLLDQIDAEINNWKKSGLWDRCDGIIARSSTNAEDIEGFNAAGLYESVPLPKDELNSKSILKALLQVWASVWNFRGFEERRLFGLDSAQVKMAILIQPWFNQKQRCNGVAITAHPFRHDFPGHHINVQKAGFLVTDSCGGARPEQHVVWIYGRSSNVIETLSNSSLMGNEYLLSEEDITRLIPVLNKLDADFGHNTEGTRSNIIQGGKKTKFCVDVEFLVLNDTGEIVILQCRPYKMVYEYDMQRNAPQKRPGM